MVQVIPKVAVCPILLPQKQFIDRFGNNNAYLDMNPSMHIDEDGQMTILVRRIDYQKFQDKQFILYNQYSNSCYAKLTCQLHDQEPFHLDDFMFQELVYEYGRPTHNTYWKGPEDIRFIDKHTILATVPECNPNGQPCIFVTKLQNNILNDFKVCEPSNIEKNWMPFKDLAGITKVIYSICPLRIKSIETAEFQTIEHNLLELQEYHGSTNGIEFGENRLFLIHINQERTYHRWLQINLRTNALQVSEPFVFFQYSYIEFPVSLAKYKDRLFISLGVNDNNAVVVELSVKQAISIKV